MTEVAPVKLHIHGTRTTIEGSYPKSVIEQVTSYQMEGAEHSQAYKRGVWDGRVKLANLRNHSVPTGLLDAVIKALESMGKVVEVYDHRVDPGRMDLFGEPSYALNGVKMEGKYAYQLVCAKAAVAARQGILDMCTGSGKSNTSAAIITALNLPTLYVVPSVELMQQIYENFLRVIPGATPETVGRLGAGLWEPRSWINIAIIDTLESKITAEDEECVRIVNSADVLFGDECHKNGAKSYYTTIQAIPAFYRFGLSGTPLDRTDGGSLSVIASYGEVICKVGYKQLVESGVLPHATVIFDKVPEPVLSSKSKKPLTWHEVYSAGIVKNEKMRAKVLAWVEASFDAGLSCLVLVDQIQHGTDLDDAIWSIPGKMISHTFIHGSSSEEERTQAIRDFSEGRMPVLVASSILDTGVSIDKIDVLVLASSGKSKIRTLQRLGRALRGSRAIVIDFVNTTHKMLARHSFERLSQLKEQDCFRIISGEASASILKREWDRQAK